MNYITTNNKWARQRGTTLIELSVVIAVILLLASVLFVGVTAWRNAANRAAAVVLISSIQKAVRGYQNSHLLNGPTATTSGDPLTTANLIADNYFDTAMPKDPSNGGQDFSYPNQTVPAIGTAYANSLNSSTQAVLTSIVNGQVYTTGW